MLWLLTLTFISIFLVFSLETNISAYLKKTQEDGTLLNLVQAATDNCRVGKSLLMPKKTEWNEESDEYAELNEKYDRESFFSNAVVDATKGLLSEDYTQRGWTYIVLMYLVLKDFDKSGMLFMIMLVTFSMVFLSTVPQFPSTVTFIAERNLILYISPVSVH